MNINRTNYEAYFIDLIDGTLSAETVDELLDFMRENPDLAEELKGLEKMNVEPENHSDYNFKHLLKTEIDQTGVFEETCIRAIENDLTTSEETEFNNYLASHSKAKEEYQLFEATIAEPDLMLAYKNKNKLLKRRTLPPFWYAVAAILLLGIVFWFTQPAYQTEQTTAQVIPLYEQPSTELEINSFKPQFNTIIEKQKNEVAQNEVVITKEVKREVISIQPLSSNQVLALTNQTIEASFELELIPNTIIEINKPGELYPTVGELIAEEIDKIDPKQEANKIGRAALNRLNDVSNNKFRFSTNQAGKVEKIAFSSKLLAFSIPVNTNRN